jgi:uncharacterized membrane protein
MEQTNTSLFSLSIDPVTKAHLHETARWAKFLAIIGFIFLALMLIGGIFMIATMSAVTGGFEGGNQGFGMFAGYGVGFFAIFYIIIALIVFFPLIFMLRFANRMKAALVNNDQQQLNTSFQNLKAYFRFWGIVTIIGLAFYAIAFIFGILGAAAFS